MGSASGAAEDRFVAGTIVADRYRIVGQIGRGSMGEVYRADDLTLGQSVALKFLPPALDFDEGRRERFLNEVRVARQITHPALTRVHDIGEAEGRLYLSMEFVDGENLAASLKRIGRFPQDKAVELARQLCAGIAAAHDQGVLHRDLKPENILLDGRGKVRITDFGLAAAVDQVAGAEARSGTPAYMSPEQLAGGTVTHKSDLYSLGLVFYELFTGRKPFAAGKTLDDLRTARETSSVPTPSSLVAELDPKIERVVLACLEARPEDRPASAIAISAALPGGDPLAAALAAGETPSPELVAAAGLQGSVEPRLAWAGLAFAVVVAVSVPSVSRDAHLIGHVPLSEPVAVLEAKARDIGRALGYAAEPQDRDRGFHVDSDYIRWVESEDETLERWRHLPTARPAVARLWYRESPRPLISRRGAVVRREDPPLDVTGMTRVEVDTKGHLVEFVAVPPEREEPADGPVQPVGSVDWSAVFDLAGLDVTAFELAAPLWTPPVFADERFAWTGRFAEGYDGPMRIEAATYRGRVTSFRILGEWSRPSRQQPRKLSAGQQTANSIVLAVVLGSFSVALVLARRNWRLGRGDRRGAMRLGLAIVALMTFGWALVADHVSGLGAEVTLFARSFGIALLLGGLLWLLYLAVEPYVRRRWPERLISWTRLLGGRFGDPLVGRDLLVGCCLGGSMALVAHVFDSLPAWTGAAPTSPGFSSLDVLLGGRFVIAAILSLVIVNVLLALIVTVLFLMLSVLLRREWIAAVVIVLLLGVQQALQMSLPIWMTLPFGLIIWALPVLTFLRFGLLPLASGTFVVMALANYPLTPSLGAWYATPTWLLIGTVLALAFYGFRTALGGRSAFGSLLEE